MATDLNAGTLNTLFINERQLNEYVDQVAPPCNGVTLFELRQRFRAELSNYRVDTLIPTEPYDIEMQWINDGVGQLWPHDWQAVQKAYIYGAPQRDTYVYVLPDDCGQPLSVFTANQDLNSRKIVLSKLPHYDGWTYDESYIDAVTELSTDGPWLDAPQKAIVLRDDAGIAFRPSWLIVRYARRWPLFVSDTDCINPAPSRILAIIYYACHQYFNSQFQVSTESIRYQNYMAIAQRFQQLSQQQLIKESKPLYFS